MTYIEPNDASRRTVRVTNDQSGIVPRDVYVAAYGERFILVAPEHGLVAAATAGATDDPKHLRKHLERDVRAFPHRPHPHLKM
jgi:hypothetical protein